ncbi:MAG: cupredoxin domain-containing protein [bacterium]
MSNKPFVTLICMGVCVFIACGTPGKQLAPTTETAKFFANDTLKAEMVLKNFYFEPSRIVTEVNRPLQLTLKKRSGFLGLVPHDFNLVAPAAGLEIQNQDVPGGEGVVITLTPTKTGEFKFYCSKDGHAKKGMVGYLIVKDRLTAQ